jgi:hypothetical protein
MEPFKTTHIQSFTTALNLAERENSIKSAFYTSLIVLTVALVLWFCSLHMEMPIPLPETEEIEVMAAEVPASEYSGTSGAEASAWPETDPTPPVKQVLPVVHQTVQQESVAQKKSPEKQPEQAVDNSIQNMRDKRRQAELDASANAVKTGGKGVSEGGDTKGNSAGDGDNDRKEYGGFKTANTFHGRVFRGGNTSTDCHEGGKVVLEVQLMPSGKIIFEDVDPATTGSDCLIKAAREILRNSNFNSSENPASIGTITFIFKLN